MDTETRLVPPQFAWSDEPENDEAQGDRSWWAAILLSVLIVALAAGTGWRTLQLVTAHDTSTHSIPSVPASPPNVEPAVPQSLPAVPDAFVLNVDRRYVALIKAHGIATESDDRTINAAHVLCNYARRGSTPDQLASGMQAANPEFTSEQVVFLVNLSLDTYCPAQ